MTLKEACNKLSLLKAHHKALLAEITLFDDQSGLLYFDLDDPDRTNIELQFESTDKLVELLEIPEKGGSTVITPTMK